MSSGGYYARGYDAFSITATARKNEEAVALEAIYTEQKELRNLDSQKVNSTEQRLK